MDPMGVLALLCIFIAAPLIVFGFVYLNKRSTNQVKALQLKKEMLELEVEKEELHMKALAEENRKYDRVLGGTIEGGGK
jgi:hypothetical protein